VLQRLAEHWWVVLIRGLAGILFGLLALTWPGITLLALILLFGAYAFVDGVSSIVAAVSRSRQHRRWGLLAFEGIVGVAAGILTFVWPGRTAVVLLVIIAIWAVWTGILEIMAGVRIRREVKGEWMLYLSGAASVLFGLLLLASPGTGAVALAWLIGIYALLFGCLLAVLAFRLRQMRERLARPGAEPAV
jgi:uncharacterized membrane protein HdeD (DUF308 family)